METNEQKLARLIRENPGLPVIPFVDGGSCEGYICSVMELKDSQVGEIATMHGGFYDEKTYDDREEFIEDWVDANWEYGDNETLYEKAKEEAEKAFTKAIIIYIV